MNCKPQDLAVIVQTHPNEPATKQFLGRTVRLTASYSDEAGGVAWNYERMPLRGRHAGGNVEWHGLPDEWLKPLRDPGEDARDETLTWKQVPAPVAPEVTA